jgi:hypothetical protein
MRYSKILTISAISGLSLFVSCSTTIPVRIQHAPEIYIPNIKTASVDIFNTDGNLSLNLVSTGGGIMGSLLQAGADLGSSALLANKEKNKSFSQFHRSGLLQALASNGYYSTKQDNSGELHLGGGLQYSVEDKTSEEIRKDSKGNNQSFQIITRTASVEINLSAIGVNSSVIGGSTIRKVVSARAEGSTLSMARGNISGWEDLVRSAISQSWETTVSKVAPYYVTEMRTLQKGNGGVIKDGNKAAAKNDFKMARALWLEGEKSGKSEDIGASKYNQAIMAEVEGDLPKSLALFEEAKQITGESDWMKDILRIQARIEEEQKIKALSQSTQKEISIVPVQEKNNRMTIDSAAEINSVPAQGKPKYIKNILNKSSSMNEKSK